MKVRQAGRDIQFRKVTPTFIEFVDIAGLVREPAEARALETGFYPISGK